MVVLVHRFLGGAAWGDAAGRRAPEPLAAGGAALRTPRRTWRVLQLVAVLWVLSLADLFFTLWAHLYTPFHEVNPIARALLEGGALAGLVAMKVSLTAFGAGIFWGLRRHGRAEAALWLVVGAYVLLALRWSAYTSAAIALGVGGF